MSSWREICLFVLMGIRNRIRTANDNAPAVETSHGIYSAGRVIRPKSLAVPYHPHTASKPLSEPNKTPEQKTTASLKLTLSLWVTALVLTLFAFIFDAGTGPKVLASITLLWAGLWGNYVSADHERWRLSELTILSAIGGLIGAVTVSANYFKLGMTLVDGLILMSIVPLVLGYILKSRICVLASICAGLVWAGLNFSGLAAASIAMLAFPFICLAQFYTGTRIRSKLAVTLSVSTAYIWLIGFMANFWLQGQLPLTFAVTLLFIIGAAHHRSGKAAEDLKLTGCNIHIYAGWIAAITGAIGFQYFWLNPDAVVASTATLSAFGLSLWKLTVGLSLAVIFISGVVRHKSSQITIPGIFLLTLASALIPLMLWVPQWPRNVIAHLPGMSLMPTIGIFMGAAIVAVAIGMGLNGIRRRSLPMMGLAITAITAQAYLLLNPLFLTFDNVIVFISGFLAALAVGGSIAGWSLSHSAPAPRFKPA